MTCLVPSWRSSLTALTVAAMLSGCGSSRGYGPTLSYLIEVYVGVTGTGGGVVESTDAVVNIDCTLIGGVVDGTCADSFPEAGAGGSFRLVALPDPGSVVQSWTGCSEVSGASCTLNFSAAAEDTVFRPTASFGPATPPPGGNGWVQLGAAVASANEVEPDPSLLLDGSGRPVVAYRERLPGDVARIYVKRYEGGVWTPLGSGPVNPNPNEAFTPSLAIDNSGTLFVAWSEYTGVSQRVHVSRFTGSDWESTVAGNGAVDALGAAAAQPALVISGAGVPILAWAQGGSVQVRSFISNQWVQPPVGFVATTAYDVRLQLDQGIPVLAWVEGVGAANVINVSRGFPNGGGFSNPMGGPANVPPPAGTPSINFFDVVVDQGTTYVIYAEGTTEFTVRARRLTGSSWEEFGAGVVPLSGPQELMGLAVDPSRLVVAFSARGEVIDGSLFAASYYSPSGWTLLTDFVNLSRIDAPVGLSLAMATPTSPVVAGGVQVGEQYELRVRQYLP